MGVSFGWYERDDSGVIHVGSWILSKICVDLVFVFGWCSRSTITCIEYDCDKTKGAIVCWRR